MTRKSPALAWLACVLVLPVIIGGACGRHRQSFLLGTTTSVDNSGLLDYLRPMFEKRTGIEIHALVVGSGKALRMAREGKVDVVISHDPEAEREFLKTGRAALYQRFMRNEFILVGPPENPARIVPGDSAVEAFAKIAKSGSRFASRNDSSGTHARELQLWKKAAVDPRGSRSYFPLGQPMSALLRSASELKAYTLSDRATFEQLRRSVKLVIVTQNDRDLTNIYAVTLVRRDHPTRETRNGEAFVRWLLSDEGRKAISSYRIRGQQVFFLLPAGR